MGYAGEGLIRQEATSDSLESSRHVGNYKTACRVVEANRCNGKSKEESIETCRWRVDRIVQSYKDISIRLFDG